MIGFVSRLRSLLATKPIRTQFWKKFGEKVEEPPSQKDFLSKSVGGDPFYQMPFQFRNHMRFTLVFLIYFAVPFWAPLFVVHTQLYKRAQN